MASQYLLWKYRDVQPDAPLVLTREQKLRNWWHYHKWHLVLGAVLLGILADVLGSALGIGQIRPDYQAAYIGSAALPAETAAALETALAAYGQDCNGDGRVVVRLNQYTANDQNTEYTYASQVTLMGDLEACDSYFFILEDGETFQRKFDVLALADGSLHTGFSGEYYAVPWPDCPILQALPLGEYTDVILGQQVSGAGQTLLQSCTFARRGFAGGKTCRNREACDALWDALTEGAPA